MSKTDKVQFSEKDSQLSNLALKYRLIPWKKRSHISFYNNSVMMH